MEWVQKLYQPYIRRTFKWEQRADAAGRRSRHLLENWSGFGHDGDVQTVAVLCCACPKRVSDLLPACTSERRGH